MVIFHLIDNFKRGGAETLLYEVVKNLKGHQHYVITLTNENDFSSQEIEGFDIFPLGFRSFVSLPVTVIKLKKLIARYKPDIIHAHLPLSSLVARLSVPKRNKLVISVHNMYSESLKKISPRLFWLEKKMHSRREDLLFVSGGIKEDYQQIIGIKGRSFVLYNFVADKFFVSENQVKEATQPHKLQVVAVGSLKYQKNFDTLIKAFALLDQDKFSLDIYGDGPERKKLGDLIQAQQNYNIQLKGSVANVESQLKHYHVFILASRYEGFGLAPLEAAAIGLPLLLSDIGVFKEVTKGNAMYFSPENEKDIAAQLQNISDQYDTACETARNFKPLVKQYYSKHSYMQQLINIYTS